MAQTSLKLISPLQFVVNALDKMMNCISIFFITYLLIGLFKYLVNLSYIIADLGEVLLNIEISVGWPDK
jgi:hypothetical protein